MSRKIDRLEALASDLASRYGEEDALVQSVLAAIPARVEVHAATARTDHTERRLHAQGPLARNQQEVVHTPA